MPGCGALPVLSPAPAPIPVDSDVPDDAAGACDFFARLDFLAFFLCIGLVVSEAPEVAAGFSLVALDDVPVSDVPLAPGIVLEPELPVAAGEVEEPEVPAAPLLVVPLEPEDMSLEPEAPDDGMLLPEVAPDWLELPGIVLELPLVSGALCELGMDGDVALLPEPVV